MTQQLRDRITHDGEAYTKTYYYTTYERNARCTIERIKRNYLGTTATLNSKSDLNPDGWETVEVLWDYSELQYQQR